MFFNKFLLKIRFILFILLVLNISCSNEDEVYFETPVVNFGGKICIEELPNTIEKFVFAKLSKPEVGEFWDCLSSGVSLFRVFVRGKDHSKVTKEELRSFLHLFFIKDREMSDELLLEIMKLKKLFFGGSVDYILNSELHAAEKFIVDAKEMSLNLFPYIKILSLPYQTYEKVDDNLPVDQSLIVLEENLIKIAKIFSENQSSYAFTDLDQLIDALNGFFIDEDADGQLRKIKKYIPLFANIKGLLKDNESNTINAGEWLDTIKIFTEIYGSYLRYIVYVENKTVWKGANLVQLNNIVHSIDHLLTEGLKQHSDHAFSHEEAESLFDSLETAKILSDSFSAEDIKNLWRILVDKILSFGEAHSGKFKQAHLDNLINEYFEWEKAQVKINNLIVGKEAISSCDQPLFPRDSSNSIMELKEIVDCTPWFMDMDENFVLSLNYDTPKKKLKHFAVSTANWQRAIVSLLFQGYAEDSERKNNRTGLNKSELNKLYKDLKDFLVAMDIVAHNDNSYDKEIFRDTKFMLPQSNGNKIIEMPEAVEYFSGTLSSIEIGDRITAHLKLHCSYEEELGDRFGAPFFDMDCFRKEFKENFDIFYSHLPEMAWYQSSLSDEKWEKMLDRSIALTGFKNSEMPYMSRKRIIEISALMRYVENFMVRFDTNQNRYLSIAEIAKALPLFTGGMSSKRSSRSSNDDKEGEYTWEIKERVATEEDQSGGATHRQEWMEYPRQRFLSLSRGNVIKLFYDFKDMVD